MMLVPDILGNLSFSCWSFFAHFPGAALEASNDATHSRISVLMRRQHLPCIRGYMGEDGAVRGPAELASLGKILFALNHSVTH